MKIVICDDCVEDRSLLHQFLNEYASKNHLEFDIYEYTSAEDLLLAFKTFKEKPEIIFLDIYMGQLNGMDAAKQIFNAGFQGAFIFTTTSPDYAIEGYRVHAADYLLKPFSYNDFSAGMDWCKDYLTKSMKCIQFVSERFDMTVYLSDISYIEACLKNIVVHARDRQLPTLKTLGQFEMELADEPTFLRIDRGLIVNFSNIEKWNDEFLFFKNGESLSLPVRNRKKVLQKLEDLYWQQITRLNMS